MIENRFVQLTHEYCSLKPIYSFFRRDYARVIEQRLDPKIMLIQEQEVTVLKAVKQASETWKAAFNAGDAASCAAQYETHAVMQARPFGTFTGTPEIQAFWQQLIDDGFKDVEYLNPQITVVDQSSAILTSRWQMNQASGVIHQELWVLQTDGTAKLRLDDFEAIG